MIRNIFIVITVLILSACAGGVSGIMSSSGVNHWQIYRINYHPEYMSRFDQPAKNIIEDIFSNLWFKKKYGWGGPVLKNAQVAKFQRRYKDRYVSMDIQISSKQILIMTTSYSSYTEVLFDELEAELNKTFGKTNIEECYGTKDLNGHTCFESKWG